jgi:hypothetical protein
MSLRSIHGCGLSPIGAELSATSGQVLCPTANRAKVFANARDRRNESMKTETIPGMKEVSDLIQSYTYPLFRYDDRGCPALFASCVFLQVDNFVYLVTARHALQEITTGLLTRGRNTLFDVRGQGGMAQGVNGEEFDIGVLKIDSVVHWEHALRTIPPTMLTTAVEVQNPHSRAFCGFPVSKNKLVDALNRETKTVTTRCYPYFGPADFDGDYRTFGKSPDIHIGLHYEAGPDDRGRQLTTMPSPRGSSGGGAWLVPDFSKSDQVFLEGIVIECHENRYVFSTRIEYVIAFIRDRVCPQAGK